MLPVNKPSIELQDCLVDLATGSLRSEEVQQKLLQSKSYLRGAAKVYNLAAGFSLLFTIKDETAGHSSCKLEKEDLRFLYKNQIAKGGGRKIYDIIKSLPTGRICPFCGVRIIETLDHFLPKSKYPTYAVVLFNLVGCCSDCNKTKLDATPSAAEDQTIHPYYDRFDFVWLKAKVEGSSFPVVNFETNPPYNVSSTIKKRIESHFKTYELNDLYSIYAANTLSTERELYLGIKNDSGPEGLSSLLGRIAHSNSSAAPNSWKAAMYHSLSESEWFCCEGVDLIP